MSKSFPKALPHQDIQEILPDIFMVTGAMKVAPMVWFSRNMIIVRHGDELTLINTVRLDPQGLERLDALGRVQHVIKLGFFHDRDDPFYVDRYQAKFWAMDGHRHNLDLRADVDISDDTELPIPGARVMAFQTTRKPEAVVHLAREGGVILTCDVLQNWAAPGFGFSLLGKLVMRRMGFFKAHNIGPKWLEFMTPKVEDFERLQAFEYRHVLGAHGDPSLNTAHQDYGATIERLANSQANS